MKYFLYLNNDIVNSILSQAEQGLITDFINENEKGKESSYISETKVGALAKLSSSFYKFLGFETELNYENVKNNGGQDSYVSKDIVQKTLHDAAYNIAYSDIKDQMKNDSTIDDLGEYIETKDYFQYIDLKTILSYFEKDSLIDFIKKDEQATAEKAIEAKFEKLSREDQRNKKTEFSKLKRDIVEQVNKKYKNLDEMIKLLHKLLPCERMYISNKGYIIPIDDKYLRDQPESFGFKYGGLMTCVGFVTNVIGKDTNDNEEKNAFASFQYGINEVLRSILPLKDDDLFIINPIAIYYGNE